MIEMTYYTRGSLNDLKREERIVMNKTCKGCYAAETGVHPLSGQAYGCKLGYRTNGKGKPLANCPKPKSWRQLSQCSKEVR